MKRSYFIGIDVHCQFCEIAVVDVVGNVMFRDRCTTTMDAPTSFIFISHLWRSPIEVSDPVLAMVVRQFNV